MTILEKFHDTVTTGINPWVKDFTYLTYQPGASEQHPVSINSLHVIALDIESRCGKVDVYLRSTFGDIAHGWKFMFDFRTETVQIHFNKGHISKSFQYLGYAEFEKAWFDFDAFFEDVLPGCISTINLHIEACKLLDEVNPALTRLFRESVKVAGIKP